MCTWDDHVGGVAETTPCPEWRSGPPSVHALKGLRCLGALCVCRPGGRWTALCPPPPPPLGPLGMWGGGGGLDGARGGPVRQSKLEGHDVGPRGSPRGTRHFKGVQRPHAQRTNDDPFRPPSPPPPPGAPLPKGGGATLIQPPPPPTGHPSQRGGATLIQPPPPPGHPSQRGGATLIQPPPPPPHTHRDAIRRRWTNRSGGPKQGLWWTFTQGKGREGQRMAIGRWAPAADEIQGNVPTRRPPPPQRPVDEHRHSHSPGTPPAHHRHMGHPRGVLTGTAPPPSGVYPSPALWWRSPPPSKSFAGPCRVGTDVGGL